MGIGVPTYSRSDNNYISPSMDQPRPTRLLFSLLLSLFFFVWSRVEASSASCRQASEQVQQPLGRNTRTQFHDEKLRASIGANRHNDGAADLRRRCHLLVFPHAASGHRLDFISLILIFLKLNRTVPSPDDKASRSYATAKRQTSRNRDC